MKISFKNFINEKYEYLNDEDEIYLNHIIEKFILKRISNIDNIINIYFYIDNDFDNFQVWENIIAYDKYENNIYGFVDKNFNKRTPNVRNSLQKLIKKYYKQYNINKLLDDKLINIINTEPKKYSYLIIDSIWKDDISKYVHKSLEWIKNMNKYNL
jgi:hypothetical protein